MRFVDEVCNLFDMEVLCDIEPIPDRIEWEVRYKPMIAIGSRSDQVSFIMTPWFTEEAKLEGFLGLHIESLRAIAADDVHAPYMCNWTKWS